MVGLVNNQAFNGHLGSYPFNFKHYNLSEIALYLDGEQQFSLKPIQPDYANGLCQGYVPLTLDVVRVAFKVPLALHTPL